MPQLTCERVQFYSEADEAAFFRFAKGIEGVTNLTGSSESILLDLGSQPTDQSLRDLIALFERYRIPRASQLAQFLSDSNKHWFADPQKFWHKKVFDEPTRHV
jgi:hypothetical protein